MTSFEFTVPGAAAGKGRHRTNRQTGVQFTPKATRLAEAVIADHWAQAGAVRLADGPVSLWVGIAVQRPKGHYRKDGELSADGVRRPHPDNKKPDIDNALKLVMDALNGRAWRDDVQVIRVQVVRFWHSEPFTTVRAGTVGGVHVLGSTDEGAKAA